MALGRLRWICGEFGGLGEQCPKVSVSLCVLGGGAQPTGNLQFEILVGGVGERKERMLVLR